MFRGALLRLTMAASNDPYSTAFTIRARTPVLYSKYIRCGTAAFLITKEVTADMMKDITIEIAGREYQLKTDEDPEYVRELANFVTVKILEIKRDSGASALDCATMAALDMADRYLKEQQKKKQAPKRKAASQSEVEPTTLY